MMKKYKVGYTQGTFDLFHVGHLNLLRNAKEQCEYLIVGVNSDELVLEYKEKVTCIKEVNRAEIVNAIKGVDEVYVTDTLDKEIMYNKIKFDVIFIGNDWENNARWIETEKTLKKHNVDVIYLPYTKGISTTQIREGINK